jgi:hypothetical protein
LTTVDPPGAAAGEKLAGRVLVWVDAPLQLAPGAPSFRLATLPGPRKDHIGEAVPMRVIAAKGDLIEVETPKLDEAGNDDTDCAWFDLRPPWDVDAVRLFVHRADLAPVARQHRVVTFPDGTSITVEPGAPIVPLADGRVELEIGRLVVAAALPAGVVGSSYPRLGPERDWKPKWVLDAREVALGDDRYAMPQVLFPFTADHVEARGDRTLFPIEGQCAKAVVAVPASAVSPYKDHPDDAMSGMGMGGLLGAERWMLPAGTALTAYGRVVAHAARPIDVSKPAAGAKQVCIQRALDISSNLLSRPELASIEDAGKLELCAPARAVQHHKGMSGLGTFAKRPTK